MTTRAPEPRPLGAGAGRAPSSAARRSALSDLVSALLEARPDPTGQRFDAELEALERAGEVSPEAARLLRYWQRASVRAVVDHARLTLPPTLAALQEADEEAARGAAEVAESWAQASGWPGERARGAASGTEDAPGAAGAGSAVPTSLSGHRRRLLVAGLTRQSGVEDFPEPDHLPEPGDPPEPDRGHD